MREWQSQSHVRWYCRYHVVWVPKYRKRAIFGEIRRGVGRIVRELCQRHGVELVEGHALSDHVHVLLGIPPKLSVANTVGFLKGKSAIRIHREYLGRQRNFTGYHFWARGYCVSTVGLAEEVIVEVLTLAGLRRYLVFFVIALQSRRVTVAGIHPQPYGAWMEQMARNLTDPVEGCLRSARYLIHDRDPLYTQGFGEILEDGGVQSIRLPPKSPNLNAYAERFVRSIKEECLSRVVPLGEGHLRLLVREYVEHYHRERNHQGLDNQLLQRPPPPVSLAADVRRRERLGGLLNFYHREAHEWSAD